MRSWSQILQLDEPVVGDVKDYEFAHEQVGAFGATAETVRDQFKKLQTTELDELQGRAALRLRELVGTVDDCLTDLPVVLHDVEKIFKKHAQELELLRTKVEEALAVAETRWIELQGALTAESDADSQLRYLQTQLRSLEYSSASPDSIETRRAELTGEISGQAHRLSSCRTSTSIAQGELGLSRGEHGQLRGEEQALIKETVQSLDSIDLRSLANPSNFERMKNWAGDRVEDVADWVRDGFEDFGKMVQAFADGEWNDALHYFRDVLDKLSTAIAVIGVLSCLIAAPFTAGSSLLLIPGVMKASAAVDAISLGVGVLLENSQAPHPETGEPVTKFDLAQDAFFTLLATAGGKGIRKAAPHVTRWISKLPKMKFLPKWATPKWTRYSNGFYDKKAPFTPGYHPVRGKGIHPNTRTRAFYDNTRQAIGDNSDVVSGTVSDIVSDRVLESRNQPTLEDWENLGGQLDWVSEDDPAYKRAFEKIRAEEASLELYRTEGASLHPDGAVCQLVEV